MKHSEISAIIEKIRWGPPMRRSVVCYLNLRLISASSGKTVNFWRKGAALLDQHLVNDALHWFREAGYDSVLKPFEKGLRHLLESHIQKHVLSDVITDMYEALEALAKIVTGRDKDLSANQQSFISKVKASDHYKLLLKDYIDYPNDFRRHTESSTDRSLNYQSEKSNHSSISPGFSSVSQCPKNRKLIVEGRFLYGLRV